MQKVQHLDYWYNFNQIGFLWVTQHTVQNRVPAILVAVCWILVSKVSCLRPVASSALYLLLYGRRVTFTNVGLPHLCHGSTWSTWSWCPCCWPSFYRMLGLVKSDNSFPHFSSGVFTIAIVAEAMKVNRLWLLALSASQSFQVKVESKLNQHNMSLGSSMIYIPDLIFFFVCDLVLCILSLSVCKCVNHWFHKMILMPVNFYCTCL